MRFLLDAQLPPGLVAVFVAAGHEAVHVASANLLSARDVEIRVYAARNGCVIVTKDEDFATARRLGGKGPQVLWIRIGNASTRALQARLAPVLDQAVRALASGEPIVEVR